MGRRTVTATLAVGMAVSLAGSPGQAAPPASQVGVAARAVPAAPMVLAAAQKKAKGTLQVVLTGSGSYTVTGKGFRKSASSSKSFRVAAGAYRVSAPGATVSRGSVKVKARKKVSVSVAFPITPVQTPLPVQTPPPVETPPPVQTPPPTDPTTPPPADTTPPGTVSGLTVGTRTASSIALSWTNPGDSDLAEVIVRRAQGATAPAGPTAGNGVTLGAPKATSVNDGGLSADTTYSYAVFTRDASNNTNIAAVAVTARTAPTATGDAGVIARVNTDGNGAQGNGYVYEGSWSPDSSRVMFRSMATNLVPNDTNSSEDVFVKALDTGSIQRVSTTANGDEANGDSFDESWSPDGARIVFSSGATNLVPGTDANGIKSDVFVKTLATGAIQRISSSAADIQADGSSRNGVWSPDGTRVMFGSSASNLVPGDTNSQSDVFVKTLSSGTIQRINTDAAGNQANDHTFLGLWSPDGGQILFLSAATNLVPGDTNGEYDLFVKTLANSAIQRINTSASGSESNQSLGHVAWSPDGSQILFLSAASNLVPGDTNAEQDLFVKTLASGAIQRITTSESGTQANDYTEGDDASWSPDGAQVMFSSMASNLVPGDTNAKDDVFIKTLATGTIRRVSTDALEAQANRDVSGATWSPDGTRIAFSSYANNLVPGDTNGETDVFVKTLVTGDVRRISADVNGAEANGYSYQGRFWSPDGTKILFRSDATNLVPGDTNNQVDLFAKWLS